MSLPATPPAPVPGPPAVPAGFELPGGREVVGRGFELMITATAQFRRVSFYFGGLFVAFLGPLLVLGVLALATAPSAVEDLGGLFDTLADPPIAPRGEDAGWLSALTIFALGLYIAIPGAAFVAAEGGIVAIVLLAGQRLGRAVGLRQALIRSRQVFWRVAVAGLLVSIPVGIGQLILRGIVDATGSPDEGSSVVALLASTVLAAPFGYAQTGVILGDVGATEAIRRSVRLFRARPWVGLAIALFPAIFNFVELAALGEGGSVLVRVADLTGLGFDSDLLHGAITLVLLLAAVAAVGSLLFTVGALFAAPQVVAFLGLTHFAGGLDRAATPQQPPTPTTVPGAPAAPIPATQALLPAGTLPVAFAAPPRLQLPKHPAPPVLTLRPRGVAFAPATASYWAARPVDPAANFHWVTRGMLLAIGALVLLAIAGIANLANRFGG